MVLSLSLSHLDPRQISSQHNTKDREQNCNQVNDCARRFKRVRIDLDARLAVTVEPRDNEQHAPRRSRSFPATQSIPEWSCASLELEKLLERNREAADGESKNYRGDAGTNPRQESTFVRQGDRGRG